MCILHDNKIVFQCQKKNLSIFLTYFLHFRKNSFFVCTITHEKSNGILFFRQEYFLTKLKQKQKKTDNL